MSLLGNIPSDVAKIAKDEALIVPLLQNIDANLSKLVEAAAKQQASLDAIVAALTPEPITGITVSPVPK